MDVKLHPGLAGDPDARRAADAIGACVHCGFCLPACPTYRDTADERDSPRGRIYLLRDMLIAGEADSRVQYHLDRCLGCRACETACPSGVRYGTIADAGSSLLEQRLQRPVPERLKRWLLRHVVAHPRRFAPLLALARRMRPLLPAFLREQVPPPQPTLETPVYQGSETRSVVLLEGCVQSCATPRSNQAARQILANLGVRVAFTPQQGCCGALAAHLGEPAAARDAMRRNIDAWWPAVEAGAEAVLFTATGCGVELTDYARALADDPRYAAKAQRVSDVALDLSQFLLAQPLPARNPRTPGRRVAVHIPCSQNHALKAADTVRTLLSACGYDLCRTRDDSLCCGSAGAYSLLQPAMSNRLRVQKLEALQGDQPEVIATANVGCQLFLGARAAVPVVHWTELYWEATR